MTENEVKHKKRGRKPKNEYYMNKKINLVDMQDKAIIINIPINLDEVFDIKNSEREQEIIGMRQVSVDPFDDFSTVMNCLYEQKRDDLFIQSKNTTEEIIENSTKKTYHEPTIPNILNKNNLHKKIRTDIYCFWCCHSFNNQPVFMPCKLNKDVFNVKGVFCSFECCLSYMSSSPRYFKNIHLLKYMYYLFTGKKFYRDTLKKSPERECLKIFGGPLDIIEFREGSCSYEVLEYPMSYIPSLVEKNQQLPDDINRSKILLSDFIKKI